MTEINNKNLIRYRYMFIMFNIFVKNCWRINLPYNIHSGRNIGAISSSYGQFFLSECYIINNEAMTSVRRYLKCFLDTVILLYRQLLTNKMK